MTEQAYCTSCGSQLAPEDRFCGSCGTPIRTANRLKRWLLFGGVALAVLIVVVLAAWLVGDRRVPANSAASPVTHDSSPHVSYESAAYSLVFEIPPGTTVTLPPGQAGSVVKASNLVVNSPDTPCTLGVRLLANPEGLNPVAYADAFLESGAGSAFPAPRVLERRDGSADGRQFHEIILAGFEGPTTVVLATEGSQALEMAIHCPEGERDEAVGNVVHTLLASLRLDGSGETE